MATAIYLQRGEALDYTNTSDELIPQDTIVVVGDHIGVTGCPIPPGKVGSLHMGGVFSIKKTGTAAIEMGKTVYFDGTGITDAAAAPAAKTVGEGDDDEKAAAPAANIVAGYAAAPTEASAETILVKICG